MTTKTRNGTAPAAAPAWRNRITGSGTEDPSQLLANPGNWRTHPVNQRAALRGSLDTVGWVQQVMVNQRTGFVVDGHARLEEAITRGEPSVPVLYVDLSPEEEAIVLATLDPIGAMADRDGAKLAALLAEITVDDAGLRALLVDLAGTKRGLVDPDDVPEPPEAPYVKPGELYVLGDHRLLCGDATNADDVARLLDGATPRLLATDPPYGVSLDPTWRDNLYNDRLVGEPGKRGKNIAAAKPYMMKKGLGFAVGGRDGPAEKPYMQMGSADPYMVEDHGKGVKIRFPRRTAGHTNTSVSGDTRVDWSEAYALVPSLEVGYVWHAGIYAAEVAAGLQRIGFEIASQVIWDKGLFAMMPVILMRMFVLIAPTPPMWPMFGAAVEATSLAWVMPKPRALVLSLSAVFRAASSVAEASA